MANWFSSNFESLIFFLRINLALAYRQGQYWRHKVYPGKTIDFTAYHNHDISVAYTGFTTPRRQARCEWQHIYYPLDLCDTRTCVCRDRLSNSPSWRPRRGAIIRAIVLPDCLPSGRRSWIWWWRNEAPAVNYHRCSQWRNQSFVYRPSANTDIPPSICVANWDVT